MKYSQSKSCLPISTIIRICVDRRSYLPELYNCNYFQRGSMYDINGGLKWFNKCVIKIVVVFSALSRKKSSTRRVTIVEQELHTLPEHPSSLLGFSGVRVTRSLVLCVCFIDHCLSFCTFSFGHCVFCLRFTDFDYLSISQVWESPGQKRFVWYPCRRHVYYVKLKLDI